MRTDWIIFFLSFVLGSNVFAANAGLQRKFLLVRVLFADDIGLFAFVYGMIRNDTSTLGELVTTKRIYYEHQHPANEGTPALTAGIYRQNGAHPVLLTYLQ